MASSSAEAARGLQTGAKEPDWRRRRQWLAATGQVELMELMEDLQCSQGECSPPEGLAQLQGS